MARRKEQQSAELTQRRFRRGATGGPSSMTAFGIGLGALLLGGTAVFVYHVSSLRSGNGDLRVIAGAAEDKSRDQARRLVERLGQTATRSAPEAKQPAPDPAPPSPTAATERTPPNAVAVMPAGNAQSDIPSQPQVLPTSTSDTSALARFLLSEHDVSPAIPLPSPTVPAAEPALDRPMPAALPAPPTRPNANPPPTVDARRRRATAAECTAVIEQAQLGDLTDRDRLFLQENCR